MGKVKIEMPTQWLDTIAGMGNALDAAIPRALEAGGKVVLDRMKSNLRAAIGRGTKVKSRSTGKLAAALGVSPARLDRDNNLDVKVGFDENRGDLSNETFRQPGDLRKLLAFGRLF